MWGKNAEIRGDVLYGWSLISNCIYLDYSFVGKEADNTHSRGNKKIKYLAFIRMISFQCYFPAIVATKHNFGADWAWQRGLHRFKTMAAIASQIFW